MNTTTEFTARTEAYYTYLVTIFLAEQSDCAKFFSFLNRSISMLVKMQVLANHAVYNHFYLTQFLVSDFLEMSEVKAQCCCVYIRTFLFHVISKNLLQSIVKQVSSSVICCTSVTLVDVYTCHEISVDVLR